MLVIIAHDNVFMLHLFCAFFSFVCLFLFIDYERTVPIVSVHDALRKVNLAAQKPLFFGVSSVFGI